jgi:hypothetical protein
MDVLRILKDCKYFRFLLVELALDFKPESGVNRTFVKKHGLFGKSRRRLDRGGPGQLRYGSRKSGKLIRCYWKEQVKAFRVELELHSRLLGKARNPREDKNYNYAQVPNKILPHHCRKHVRFVRVRWQALQRYLERRSGQDSAAVLQQARAKACVSLQSVTAFLRRKQVNNVHRFLAPMRINEAIGAALTKWEMDFHDDWNKLL